jgi:hypothetical protein
MKEILLIEDDYTDFSVFVKLLRKHRCSIYPRDIDSNDSLIRFLGLTEFTPTMKANERLSIIQQNIYNYIKQNKLYSSLSAIILDINLLDLNEDKSGLRFLEDFRSGYNLELPNQYNQWNKVIPFVALTNYKKSKYESEFTKYPGYLARMFNKEDVSKGGDESNFLSTIDSFNKQMSAIYPLFFAPELKEILYIVNQNQEQLKDIRQISKLLLWSNIASMDANKRNAFVDNFANELIKYVKENDAFMVNIEDIENNFKNAILKIFNSPPIKILQICSLFGAKIDIGKIPDVFNKASELIENALLYK